MARRTLQARLVLTKPLIALALGSCSDPVPGDAAATDNDSTAADGTGTADLTTATATSTAGSTSQSTTESSSSSTAGDPTETSSSDSTSSGAVTIPLFVALGDGGWTASSCDRGHSWTVHAFSDEQGDHTQWTGFGGLAFGNGGFVAGLGWGGEGGHLLHSNDGRSWLDLPPQNFIDGDAAVGYAIYTSGVAYTGTEFLVFSQSAWRSDDGQQWQTSDVSLPPGSEQLRQLRGFADQGLIVASVESQSGNDHPAGHFVVVSDDGGTSWSEGTGYSSACSDPIQHWGDIVLVGDVLLVGTNDVCRSPDRGATWSTIAAPTGESIQDLAEADGEFLALSGSRVFGSPDGNTWTELGDAGIPGRAVAYADGAYAVVGTMGTAFAFSEDGSSWTAATVRGATGEVWVRDLVVGAMEGTCD